MRYIKHPVHGYLAVPSISPSQTENGWEECDIYAEIAAKKPAKKSLAEMDRRELEIHARTLGVELDRRKSKANMLRDLEAGLQ